MALPPHHPSTTRPPVCRSAARPRGPGVASTCRPVDVPCGESCDASRAERKPLMRQGPLAGRYPAVAAMVMFALIPYLALSAALGPLTPIIAKQLHTSLQTMSLGAGLGNAGVRARHGAGGAVRPAPPAAPDAGRLRGAARHRIGADGLGAGRDDVHRGPHHPGPVHQPAPDRRRAAPGASAIRRTSCATRR